MFFATKKVFTVIEMLVVIVMIASWLLVMYWVINSGLSFVDYTRKKLIAVNIAREWIEAVYNIRDTNWTRWSWKRDKCWLKVDPLVDKGWNWCEDDPWMQSWDYVLKLKKSDAWQLYWMLSGVDNELNIFDWVSDEDEVFQVCLSWWYWVSCPDGGPVFEWRFFREIKGLWLIDKKDPSNNISDCSNWEDSNCWDESAKEFRFCSIVQYIWNWLWKVQMCWVLTNFKK